MAILISCLISSATVHKFQHNLSRSKYSMSSIKFVFFSQSVSKNDSSGSDLLTHCQLFIRNRCTCFLDILKQNVMASFDLFAEGFQMSDNGPL